jgi:hypothetical protein
MCKQEKGSGNHQAKKEQGGKSPQAQAQGTGMNSLRN